ncbi:MAG: pseudouridine-5'-phosphate glycosidase [Chloroflexi bacterium]|nr:pseudouridine-5'-phosphate glycosidase [Chloroflexota bacterium]
MSDTRDTTVRSIPDAAAPAAFGLAGGVIDYVRGRGPGSLGDRLDVRPEVADAIAAGRPVVALESTLISHGLPYPQNVEVARASEAAVRESGAVPATVAIHDGEVLVGLDDAHLEALATAPAGSVLKAARPSLSAALSRAGWSATTVSATMIAAHAAGIRVFATGGIGGVHRGALGAPGSLLPPTFDISSDLEELAKTPMVVVCAGPKAILDVAATMEVLETRGVPVVAVGQDDLPGFTARSSGLRAPWSVADVAAAADLAAAHLALGLGSAMVIAVPVPADAALPDQVAREAAERAAREADEAGIHGPALTPWLLARIAAITNGASVRANTALIVNDARVAGEIAVLLAGGQSGGA